MQADSDSSGSSALLRAAYGDTSHSSFHPASNTSSDSDSDSDHTNIESRKKRKIARKKSQDPPAKRAVKTGKQKNDTGSSTESIDLLPVQRGELKFKV